MVRAAPGGGGRKKNAPRGKDYVVQDGDVLLFRFNV
jgi:ribosome-binding ATPase YchF (GTP1/OBG family)